MKKSIQTVIPALLLGLLAFAPTVKAQAGSPAQRQQQSEQPSRDQQSRDQQIHANIVKDEHMDAPEPDPQIEEYRHSATVQAIARHLHLRTETLAQIFEDINSGVILLAVAFLLWKYVPNLLRSRSENLQKELVSARKATEDANRRLAEVEARLLRLDSEIDAIRQQVEREAAEDEKRIHASLETERERIIASAEQEITALQAAAQRDLKKFAADLAIDNAMRRVQLTAETDRTLIKDFGKRLGRSNSGGEA